MALPFEILVGDPTLSDVLLNFQKQIFLSFNCHAIATIQNFYDGTTTIPNTGPKVDATVNYSRSYFVRNTTGDYVQQDVPYPILLSIPLIVMGGGNACLTFPVAKGDQCLVLFNDRDIDNWVRGGTSGPVSSPRLHSFSDGIALVGPHQFPITDYDNTRVVLRGSLDGTTMVGVSQTKIKIANTAEGTLGTILGNLMTAIETLNSTLVTLTTAMSTATPSTVVAQIATPSGTAETALTNLSTTFSGIATSLGGLLE